MKPRAVCPPVSRAAGVCVFCAVVLPVSLTTRVSAQTSELMVEIGGSQVLPPSGVDGDAAGFLVAGLRGTRYGLGGSGVYGSILLGRATDASTGGDFLSGEVGGSAWRALDSSWSLGLQGRGLAFTVQDPFPYHAGAVEGSVTMRYQTPLLQANLTGEGGAGQSTVTLTEEVQRMRRITTTTQVLEDDLWRWGGTVDVMVGRRSLSAGVAGGLYRSAGGSYRSGGIRLVATGGFGALEVRGDVWRTPAGNETTGGVALYIPWGAWSVRGSAGKPQPDPLLLADPGRGAGGVLVGRRVAGRGPLELPRTRPLHRVLEQTDRGTRVRFQLRAPVDAKAVQVLGDFTLWDPVAMTSSSSGWTLDLVVPEGTHHFGFLVDGAWYIPDDAPDVVPDEWGRQSATLVVEGVGAP